MAGKSQLDKPTKTLEELAADINEREQSLSAKPLSAEDLQVLVDDPDAVRKLCKLRLLEIVANSARTTALTPVIKELMDRTDGKPAQSIAMTVEARGIDKLSDDRLLALERELARITGQEALVIPPMPKKLSE